MPVIAKVYRCPATADHEKVKADLRRSCPDALIQSTRVEAVSNPRFAELVAAQTFASLESGQLLANKPEMDLLLRLARTAQISQAIQRVGARRGEPFLAIVVSRGKRIAIAEPPGEPLTSKDLSEEELDRVEEAALLSALKA